MHTFSMHLYSDQCFVLRKILSQVKNPFYNLSFSLLSVLKINSFLLCHTNLQIKLLQNSLLHNNFSFLKFNIIHFLLFSLTISLFFTYYEFKTSSLTNLIFAVILITFLTFSLEIRDRKILQKFFVPHPTWQRKNLATSFFFCVPINFKKQEEVYFFHRVMFF